MSYPLGFANRAVDNPVTGVPKFSRLECISSRLPPLQPHRGTNNCSSLAPDLFGGPSRTCNDTISDLSKGICATCTLSWPLVQTHHAHVSETKEMLQVGFRFIRIAQVQSLASPNCWNHCSGSKNSADFTTKGESTRKFLTSLLWWMGPTWLSEQVQSWPMQCLPILPDGICDEEAFPSERRQTAMVNTMASTTSGENCNSVCIDIDKYSTLEKLLRVTAWVRRFVYNAKADSLKFCGPLCASELQEALYSWIKATQLKHFELEVKQLLSKGIISKNSSIYSLNPELDDNQLLQLKGRLEFSNEDVRAKHPWLLPNKVKFVKLRILDAHVKMCHLGVDGTLTHLREQFWIIKGRKFVKNVLNECIICRRYKVKPGNQVVAPLPPDRIQEHSPFDVSGVDFAESFYVNEFNTKCYLIIFTYAVVRAIHLELVSNMSTDSFLLAFRRFISRRGLCSVLYSDNTKTFKKANSELRKWWKYINNPKVKKVFASKGVVWKFIVERSPCGGEVSGRDKYAR
ncbi:unnamed protein product [Larinioides sclopetarius]|uniref:Integrase zinc-binding domain-containing protein n=1 Tax=Larinioides sclopetarius TaxID=280406 RepID=A0AAV2BDX1_9ARAC